MKWKILAGIGIGAILINTGLVWWAFRRIKDLYFAVQHVARSQTYSLPDKVNVPSFEDLEPSEKAPSAHWIN